MNLSNGERSVIYNIIVTKGVNKQDARMVVSLNDKLNLEDPQSFRPSETDDNQEYDLAEVELGWIKDRLNGAFNESRVPSFLSKWAISLIEKLEA